VWPSWTYFGAVISFVDVIAVAVMVCGRHGFGRYSPPCGRHGLLLGPLSFVAVIAVAVMV